MIAIWMAPLLIITLAGMTDMLLSPRPQGLKPNIKFFSVAAITSGALLSIAECAVPAWHVIIFTWGAAVLMAVRACTDIMRALHRD